MTERAGQGSPVGSMQFSRYELPLRLPTYFIWEDTTLGGDGPEQAMTISFYSICSTEQIHPEQQYGWRLHDISIDVYYLFF
jgi:hypothetical protein